MKPIQKNVTSLLAIALVVLASSFPRISARAQNAAYYVGIWEKLPWVARHGLSAIDYQTQFNRFTTEGFRPIDVSGYGFNGAGWYASVWEKDDGRAWAAHHGVAHADYQAQFDQHLSEGYRLTRISGFEVNGAAYYMTVWEQNDGRAWAGAHGLTAADFQTRFDQYVSQGFRPTDVCGYTVNGVTYYAGIWDKAPGPAWVAHHGLTAADYQARFDQYLAQGYRLVRVSGYEINGVDYYAAIWEQNDGRAWVAHHGISPADFQARSDQYAGQGYRLVRSCGYKVGSNVRYAAIWEQGSGGAPWVSNHGMTSAQYQSRFTELVNQGYRLTHVSGCSINGRDGYSGVWEKRPGPAWVSHHAMTSDQYSSLYTQYVNQGYRVSHVNGYGVNGVPYFAAIWEKKSGPNWLADHGVSAADYQTRFNQRTAAGYRLVEVSGYVVNDVIYYAMLWEQSSGPAWASYNKMTASEYVTRFTQYANMGYRPRYVSGYGVSGTAYYAAIWEQNDGTTWMSDHALSDAAYSSVFQNYVGQGFRLRCVNNYALSELVPDVPATGVLPSQLTAFDEAMKRFVHSRNIPAAVICVSRNGSVVLERAYGYQDAAQTVPLKTSALFRTASLAKPITAAAIHRLAAAGRLSLTNRVFNVGQPGGGLLQIAPFGTPDTRLRNITVQHLLDHKGGWDRAISGDPMFQSIAIATALNVPAPPSQTDTVRYMMGRPLDFTPGATNQYSNFGYLLLGLIIERATGEDYITYIQRELFGPNGAAAAEVELGRSLAANRNSREPWYSDPSTDKNVFNPSQTVPSPDGGFYLEAMEAHGGMIHTARSYVQFMHGYWLSGQPRSGNGQEWWFYGSLPGTYTLARQRTDGVNIAVFFNQRQNDEYNVIKDVVDGAAASITSWPETDMVKLRPVAPYIKMNLAGGGVGGSMQVQTEAGRVYQLEATVDLRNWSEVELPKVGDGSSVSFALPMADPSVTDRMFFRVRVE